MTDKQKQKEMTVQKFLDVAITYPGYFIEENSVRKGRYSWKADAYSMLTKIKNILEKPPQYILGDGTVCCTYCGSVLGDEFDDNNEESTDDQNMKHEEPETEECVCLQVAGNLNFTQAGKPIADCQFCDGTGIVKKGKKGNKPYPGSDEEREKAINIITPVAEQAGLSSEETVAVVESLSTLSEIKPVKVSPEQGNKILAKVKAFDERKAQPDEGGDKEAMNDMAKRKPGNSKLVYDRATKTIVSVSRDGKKTKALNVSGEDADMFSQPDEELVEKIIEVTQGDTHNWNKLRDELRNLLQSRQSMCIFCSMPIKDDEGACKSCANQAMEDLSKTQPDITPKFSYDKFIKNHACILHPDRASERAHFPITEGMGGKFFLPLCHECHMELHNGDVTWYGKYKRKLGVYLEELMNLLERGE